MTTTDIYPCHTIEAIKRRYEGHFFDADTMRFWKSRVLDAVSVSAEGVSFFVTSEPYVWDGPRVYTVRSFDPRQPNRMETVGEMGAYRTSREAHAARVAEAAR